MTVDASLLRDKLRNEPWVGIVSERDPGDEKSGRAGGVEAVREMSWASRANEDSDITKNGGTRARMYEYAH